MKPGDLRYDPELRAFQVWWRGQWTPRSLALPDDMTERIDAATRHRECPEENEWPEEER